MSEQKFKAGDRVTLKAHNSWLEPYRSMAEKQRPATVISWLSWGQYKIEFDVLRRGAKPRELFCRESELEALAHDRPYRTGGAGACV